LLQESVYKFVQEREIKLTIVPQSFS